MSIGTTVDSKNTNSTLNLGYTIYDIILKCTIIIQSQSQSAVNSVKWRTTEAAKIPQSFFVEVVRGLVYIHR